MTAYLDTVDTPAGPARIAVNADGALIRLSFLDGHYAMTVDEELSLRGYELVEDTERTAHVREQLAEYAAGTRQTFDLPLALEGSEWQQAVWTALLDIPFGETRSYGDIAGAVGRPNAPRAVGRANGTNTIPLVIPCHRVVGADGTLTGFGGGLHLKTALLDHEARVLGRAPREHARQLTLVP